MSGVLPNYLDYKYGVPLSLGCEQMTQVLPTSGASSYSSGQYFTLNIPRCHNTVLDPHNSFLQFTVSQSASYTLTSSCDSHIQKIEVWVGNVQVENLDNYYNLSAALLNSTVDPITRAYTLNMTKGCVNTAGSMAGETVTATANPST